MICKGIMWLVVKSSTGLLFMIHCILTRLIRYHSGDHGPLLLKEDCYEPVFDHALPQDIAMLCK